MDYLTNELHERKKNNALRTLKRHNETLIDFSSNDYLGLSQHINTTHNNYPTGATGSRLLTGNHAIHEEVENQIAAYHGADSALLFNSGYTANIGLISTLCKKNHLILYDELAHASIREGIQLSYASSHAFKHNDISSLTKKISNKTYDVIWVITESVFSMDGDEAPLKSISDVCQEYGAKLIVDEAHALGVFGKNGSGLVNELNLETAVYARIVTFGKALGAHGAAVLGDEVLIQYLINFCRAFIYTTALPPASVRHIQQGYAQLAENTRQEQLAKNIAYFRSLASTNMAFIPSRSAIQCIMIPGNSAVKNIANLLNEKGFDVRPILSPTVPKGKERIRICLHAHNTQDQISALLKSIHDVV
jgi:8-amino-7-oxononanoate synthase